MQGWLLAVDRISAFFGKAFAWLIVGLTLLISFEVFCRYVLNSPNDWVWDTTYILYGILFMMAGAYTLSRNGHVRGDVLYGFFPVRVQAGLDLLLYFVFFFPGVVALVWAGTTFAETSWAIREHSSVTASGPPVYHFKTFIPVAGALLLLQGIAEVVRCVIALSDGAWPARLHDVEEVDVDKLKKMVGVDVPAVPAHGSVR
ncbi:MAG: TRAP transporter small permease subunit [Rhodocyclaceae bacterium]|jgi:TRAP-type mannitol/chloroaromatic compound transport system permease small subunit|nr:TRAP transporter small permease subunit [Rhodocyclaceae bacterium]MCA3074693.1 TRAP transporter small permease subunit [Rhodocyclaceae bacterium]MCA3088834.1 TRAP transporter small permease subunit [Rhodocyclaceae bacterium]MCA3095570.1 TRAP transporter small permease subunit [Rhodocyclaceae bacterium]MCA3097577.1 TRAP transporter small permease subunit [Rhodocyclaceae bacterium]